jgi:transcription antitermination protein NusB
LTRRDDRRVAIDVLYQADVTETSPAKVLDAWRDAGREVPPFTEALIAGVTDRLPDIDLLLETNAEGWSVIRMAVLDRTILRVGVYELLWDEDVPTSVAISEAVEAADELSSDDAKRFVNGILGKIARDQRPSPPVGS